jgi:hypothetical protein
MVLHFSVIQIAYLDVQGRENGCNLFRNNMRVKKIPYPHIPIYRRTIMNISHVNRRVVLLSIVVIVAVMMLAFAVGYFAITHAQASPGQAIPSGYSVTAKLHTVNHPVAAKPVADNCMAVPSWDIAQLHLQRKGSDLVQLYFKLENQYVS